MDPNARVNHHQSGRPLKSAISSGTSPPRMESSSASQRSHWERSEFHFFLLWYHDHSAATFISAYWRMLSSARAGSDQSGGSRVSFVPASFVVMLMLPASRPRHGRWDQICSSVGNGILPLAHDSCKLAKSLRESRRTPQKSAEETRSARMAPPQRRSDIARNAATSFESRSRLRRMTVTTS